MELQQADILEGVYSSASPRTRHFVVLLWRFANKLCTETAPSFGFFCPEFNSCTICFLKWKILLKKKDPSKTLITKLLFPEENECKVVN